MENENIEELEVQDTFNEDEINELVEDDTIIENAEEIEEVIDNGNED